MGTIVWKKPDDKGRTHKFKIPKSLYSPEGGVSLLSPQHWSQIQADNQQKVKIGSETTSKAVTLYWNQKQDRLTIPIGREKNVAPFQMFPGCEKYKSFSATEEVCHKEE